MRSMRALACSALVAGTTIGATACEPMTAADDPEIDTDGSPDALRGEDGEGADAPSCPPEPIRATDDASRGCPPPPCALPRTLCGESCVDLQADAHHCGACDSACGEEQGCLAGACAGKGNLEITATWSRPGDGNLLVATPSGNIISFRNPGPDIRTDRGQMDLQDAKGTGPEHVFWQANVTPPAGTYHLCFGISSFDPPPSQTLPVRYSITVTRPSEPPLRFVGTYTSDVPIGTCDFAKPGYVASIQVP